MHFVNRDSLGLANDFLSLGFIPEGVDIKAVSDALQSSFGDGSRHSRDFQVCSIICLLYGFLWCFLWSFVVPMAFKFFTVSIFLQYCSVTIEVIFTGVVNTQKHLIGLWGKK